MRFCVNPLSVARSRWNPAWLLALFVQDRLIDVADPGVAPRPVGPPGARLALGEKNQFKMSCVATAPPVPPVKPTYADVLPTVPGTSIVYVCVADLPVIVSTMVTVSVVPS